MVKHKTTKGVSIASKILGIVTGLAMLCICSTGIGANIQQQYSTPTLACETSAPGYIEVQVCAGPTGAPAGFSIQWETAADFAIYGWNDLVPSYCAASLSGVPGASQWNLDANHCVTVQIGDNLFDTLGASSVCSGQSLLCNTQYVFRAFAHASSRVNRSPFSATLTCQTLPCSGGGCTYTQGFWKTHGPVGCLTGNNTDVWPVNVLSLGTYSYSDLDLCSICNTPADTNGLISLAHQLIAAKLNIANGADGTVITQAIIDADTLIGFRIVPPVGTDFLPPSATSTLTTTLTSYNEGLIGPGHCQ